MSLLSSRPEPKTDDVAASGRDKRRWFRDHWLDILTLALMLVPVLVLQRKWGSSRVNSSSDDGDGKHFLVALLVCVLSILWALIWFALFQIRIKSFWDFNNAVFGFCYAVVSAALFSTLLTMMRHFEDEGDLDPVTSPSATAAIVCAGFGFLAIYVGAKLKLWSNYRSTFWKAILVYWPICTAMITCYLLASLQTRHVAFHNSGIAVTRRKIYSGYDVILGAIIGTAMAFFAYRMMYASVFDYRFNHIPLFRHVPFDAAGSVDSYDTKRVAAEMPMRPLAAAPAADGTVARPVAEPTEGTVARPAVDEPAAPATVRGDQMV